MKFYFEEAGFGHTYGISAQDAESFDALRAWSRNTEESGFFVQSDSTMMNPNNKEYLYIEFLGKGDDRDARIDDAHRIAKNCGACLVIDK